MNAAPYKRFLYSYRYGGKTWGEEIMAQGFKDAELRLKAIGALGRVDGILVMETPASCGTVARLVIWVRNTLHKAF